MSGRRNNYHRLLYKNLTALMLFNDTPKPLKRCVSEDMFVCPNQEGFHRVSNFLMNVFYPGNQAFRYCWPVYTKSEERAFRVALVDLIRGLNKDFGEIYTISHLIPGRLMTPGGDRFVKIIWEISLLAIGVQAKRESADDDFFVPQIPPATTPPALIKKAALLWRLQTKAKLKDVEAKLNELKQILDLHKEEKLQFQERMLSREKKLREVNAMVKLHKKSCYEDVGAEEDGEGGTEKISELLQQWRSIASLARDTKEILEATISEKNCSQPTTLDATCIPECHVASGATGNDNEAKGGSSEVSLWQYISDLYCKLDALNPELQVSQINGILSTWGSISKKEELIKSDLIQIESRLNDEFLKIISLNRSDSLEDVSVAESQGSSINISTTVRTSTPIKSKQVFPETGLFNLTPYQPATNQDYFPVNIAEALKTLSDEEKRLSIIRINTLDSSLDELFERFKKIVIKRAATSTKPWKK